LAARCGGSVLRRHRVAARRRATKAKDKRQPRRRVAFGHNGIASRRGRAAAACGGETQSVNCHPGPHPLMTELHRPNSATKIVINRLFQLMSLDLYAVHAGFTIYQGKT